MRNQRLNTHCMLHGGLRTVLGILRIKHTSEESEARHTLYAAWWCEDSPRYTELKHTGEESEARHTLYAAWWVEDSSDI